MPVRFNDTKIKGLISIVRFLYVNKNTPDGLAYKIAKKVNPDFEVSEMLKFLREWLGDDFEVNIEGTNITFKRDEDYGKFHLKMLLNMLG